MAQKTLLILFLLVTFPFVSNSQNYVPFISTNDSSDTWMDLNSCTNFSCYDNYTTRYWLDGDTIINGHTYTKVQGKTKHKKGADQGQFCTIATYYYEHYVGAIREVNKRVYFKPDLFTPSEYVAYDFNLNVGDTLPSPDGDVNANANEPIIQSIDSVLVFGQYRKRFVVNSYKYVVEGIGASTGLFNPFTYNTSYRFMQMQCYAEHGTPDYFLVNCEMNLATETIDLDKKETYIVKTVDLLGREVTQPSKQTVIQIYSDGSTRKVVYLKE